MKLTNASKGSLILWIGGDAVELAPGGSTRDLTAAEVSNLKAHPIVGSWITEGRLTGAGAPPAAAPTPAPASAPDDETPASDAPKPRRKRVTVEDKAEG